MNEQFQIRPDFKDILLAPVVCSRYFSITRFQDGTPAMLVTFS